ncbi:hypothetical protein GUJ93_ZPchr0006g46443 [Zizania palustris]|uniref:Uncharacterized protein n=1 Tax=Zizania palustris TaxID=103762 RepID=A0A8J5W2A9_ZIZPA|nr:hypothetical protein GUJ93_ZPchr0006g46443 [Zizania palustris]
MMPPVLSLSRSPSSSASSSHIYSGRRSAAVAVSRHLLSSSAKPAAGVCCASHVVELWPSLSPNILVRDARLEDCWEVADTHCSSFFPGYTFPLDLVLRIDRYVALLSGFSVPPGCMRTCLVAVNTTSVRRSISIGYGDFRYADFQGKHGLSKASIAGILTVDTVADYLPRKGPLKQRSQVIIHPVTL